MPRHEARNRPRGSPFGDLERATNKNLGIRIRQQDPQLDVEQPEHAAEKVAGIRSENRPRKLRNYFDDRNQNKIQN